MANVKVFPVAVQFLFARSYSMYTYTNRFSKWAQQKLIMLRPVHVPLGGARELATNPATNWGSLARSSYPFIVGELTRLFRFGSHLWSTDRPIDRRPAEQFAINNLFITSYILCARAIRLLFYLRLLAKNDDLSLSRVHFVLRNYVSCKCICIWAPLQYNTRRLSVCNLYRFGETHFEIPHESQ